MPHLIFPVPRQANAPHCRISCRSHRRSTPRSARHVDAKGRGLARARYVNGDKHPCRGAKKTMRLIIDEVAYDLPSAVDAEGRGLDR